MLGYMDINSSLLQSFNAAKDASIDLALLDNETINKVLMAVADKAISETDTILAANAKDLARMDPANPMYDRLKLTKERMEGIAGDTRNVATLPSPLGKVLKQHDTAQRTRPQARERSLRRHRHRL